MEKRFIAALDAQSTNWWLTFANSQDLEGYISNMTRGLTAERAKELAQSTIANRLFMVVRAVVHAGILVEPIEKA